MNLNNSIYLKAIMVTSLLASGLFLSSIANASNKFYVNVCVSGASSTSGVINATVTTPSGSSYDGDFQTNNVCGGQGTYVTGGNVSGSPVTAKVALKSASIKVNWSSNGLNSFSGTCKLQASPAQPITFNQIPGTSNYKATNILNVYPNFSGTSITSCSASFQ